MNEKLKELAQMFYPLSNDEQRRWASILSLEDREYVSSLEVEAQRRGLKQSEIDNVISWSDLDGEQLMLLFRISNPADLKAVKQVYETIGENKAPLAYTFVHQLIDGEGTWDIFHMSKLTYLAHCNRVSGPGSECEK
jgi:hypothetical protein